jgi:plastocyanin
MAHAAAGPVYVHMNGANEFLEEVVAVRPGETVVFVNEDTDAHEIVGYDPLTGRATSGFQGLIKGSPGPGHPVSTYEVAFAHRGIEYYYCSVHAVLERGPGGRYLPKVKPGVGGFGAPMAGIIIVTTDPKVLAANPKSASRKILPDFFGG